MGKFINEKFKNLNSLLMTLSSRPNNEYMSGRHSSQEKGDSSWYGTNSWDEAIELLRNGYTKILPEIHQNMNRNAKVYNQHMTLPKSMPQNLPIGYVPNVPNAIMNLPNSMISIERKPQKRKTMSIIYSIGGSAFEDEEFFIKSGVTICSAINIIEAKGIQTKLELSFMPTTERGETVFPTVTLKDYGQKFDLQKLCFPLAHPSMFRRIGFKYLETCPEMTVSSFSFGYGTPQTDIEYIKKSLKIDDNTSFFVNCHWMRDHGYDVIKLLEYFKVKEGK